MGIEADTAAASASDSHQEGSQEETRSRVPFLYGNSLGHVFELLGVSTRLDFPAQAFHRTFDKQSRAQFTRDDLQKRARLLNEMLGASCDRRRKSRMVNISFEEFKLIRAEVQETVEGSDCIVLLQFYDGYPKASDSKSKAADEVRTSSQNVSYSRDPLFGESTGLKNSHCIFQNGSGLMSIMHRRRLLRGIPHVSHLDIGSIVPLPRDIGEAQQMRETVFSRAHERGYTYALQIAYPQPSIVTAPEDDVEENDRRQALT